MENDTGVSAQTCIPTAGETKLAAIAAIEKGASEGARLGREQAATSATEAASTLAQLPARIQEVTQEHVRLGLRHGYMRLRVMPLTVENTPELVFRKRSQGSLDPRKLRNAASLIYAHCLEADLNPHIIHQADPDDDGGAGWFLCISWSMPHSVDATTPAAKNSFWWWLGWLK